MDSNTTSQQPIEHTKSFVSTAIETAGQFTGEYVIVILATMIIIVKNTIKKRITNYRTRNKAVIDKSFLDQMEAHTLSLLDVLGADRVLIYQFSDKDAVVNAHAICQVVENGISELKVNTTSIPKMYREFNILKMHRHLIWLSEKEAKEDCRNYLESIGIKLNGGILLRNKMDKPIGMINIQYCKEGNISFCKDIEKIELANDLIEEINNLLTYHEYLYI